MALLLAALPFPLLSLSGAGSARPIPSCGWGGFGLCGGCRGSWLSALLFPRGSGRS